MLRWPDKTIYGALSAIANHSPSSTALVSPNRESTYEELLERSQAVAAGLHAAGVEAGDTIGVWLGNRPEWISLQLGASRVGASVVAINTRYGTSELAHVLRDSGCRVLVTESSFANRNHLSILAGLLPELRESERSLDSGEFPDLETVVARQPSGEFPAVRPFEAFLDSPSHAPEPTTESTRPACIFYTSGTTGEPKGCLQSNRSLLNHSFHVGEYLDVSGDDVALGVLPFCGVMGYNAFMSALTHGIPLVVRPRFDPERVLEDIERHGVTYFSAIGEMYRRMVDHDTFDASRVDSLSRGAVAFVNGFDDETFERIERAVGFPLVQPYGLSEANSQVFVGDPDTTRADRKRVGGPLIHPGLEARIVDPESGDELSPGESGELQLRGYNVMEGYLNRPEATAETIDEAGWLRTGDLCHREPDGAFVFQSRLDDALRIRGFLVSPREIERVIESHPEVEAAEVVGVAHDTHGQVPVAFIIGADALTSETISRYLDDRIADFKRPDRYLFVESFPQTEGPHGAKVQKSVLRERAERAR